MRTEGITFVLPNCYRTVRENHNGNVILVTGYAQRTDNEGTTGMRAVQNGLKSNCIRRSLMIDEFITDLMEVF